MDISFNLPPKNVLHDGTPFKVKVLNIDEIPKCKVLLMFIQTVVTQRGLSEPLQLSLEQATNTSVIIKMCGMYFLIYILLIKLPSRIISRSELDGHV
jgi:hypothetical protein